MSEGYFSVPYRPSWDIAATELFHYVVVGRPGGPVATAISVDRTGKAIILTLGANGSVVRTEVRSGHDAAWAPAFTPG